MITLEKLLVLKSVGFFKHTPDEILIDLTTHLREESYLANESIIKKGEYGDTMYIIVSGKANVMNENIILAELKQYDVFGEIAALSPEIRTANVIAKEDLLILCISHDSLYEFISQNSDFAKGIIFELCDRYRKLSNQLHLEVTSKGS